VCLYVYECVLLERWVYVLCWVLLEFFLAFLYSRVDIVQG